MQKKKYRNSSSSSSEWATHKKWSHSNNLFSRRNISSLKLLTLFACKHVNWFSIQLRLRPKRKRAIRRRLANIHKLYRLNNFFVRFLLAWTKNSEFEVAKFHVNFFVFKTVTFLVGMRENVKTCQLFVFMFVCFLFRLFFSFQFFAYLFFCCKLGEGKGLIYMVRSLWIASSDVLVSAI